MEKSIGRDKHGKVQSDLAEIAVYGARVSAHPQHSQPLIVSRMNDSVHKVP